METYKTLIAVDVQREFGLAPKANPERYAKIVDFIQSSRADYDRIISTVCCNDEYTNMYRAAAWREIVVLPSSLDFHPDRYIVKHTYGLPLREVINFSNDSCEAHSYDIIGYNTDCCVLAIALQLFDIGKQIRVLTDYCYSSSGEAHHQRGVQLLKDLLGSYCI